MRRRFVPISRVLIACAAALAPLIASAPSATASCVADPDVLSIRQMIVTGTTGAEFDVLFLGRVVKLHDLGGDEGGQTLARFLVKEHPVGFAPRGARVQFYDPPPGVGISSNFEFRVGRHYAVVADRQHSGVFDFDGACGQTAPLSQQRMRRLIRLYHHS